MKCTFAAFLAALLLTGCGASATPAATASASPLDQTFSYMSDLEAGVDTASRFYCPDGWAEEDPTSMRAWVSCGNLQLILLPVDLADPNIGTGADAMLAFLKMVGPYAFAARNWAVVFEDEPSARAFEDATGYTPLT